VRPFEEELWSENPIEPPEEVDAADPAVADEGGTFTHGALVEAADRIVAEHALDEDSTVLLDAPLSEPGALVAGILAPIAAGARVELPAADAEKKGGAADLLVTATETESSGVVRPAQLTRSMRDTRRA